MAKVKSYTKPGPATNAVRWAIALLCVLGLLAYINVFESSSLKGKRRMNAPSSPSTSSSASTNGFTLAREQSFGFFDDIPDGDWMQRQRRARVHKHQNEPEDKVIKTNMKPNMYYLKNYYPLFTCPNQERVGGSGDGPKWMCDPLRLRDVHKKSSKGDKCLVYSVGCNGNYHFEDSLVDLLGAHACEIHVFDVKPHYGRVGDNTTKDIHFHGWGLKSSYTSATNVGPKFDLMTLQQTMERLGHVGRTIDIFKIDCEGCEWITYKDWISDAVDIRQLLIETHNLGRDGVTAPEFFDDIERAGFAMFSKEPNIHPAASGCGCVEWSFVKLRKDFFADSVVA